MRVSTSPTTFIKSFRGLDFGTDDDLRLLLADNYCLTTNDFTTELTERTEDAQRLLRRNSW
jgi:hypothetical protein